MKNLRNWVMPALGALALVVGGCKNADTPEECQACAAGEACAEHAGHNEACGDCQDGAMCDACAAKKADRAKAEACPDCQDGKMCAACEAKMAKEPAKEPAKEAAAEPAPEPAKEAAQ